MQFLEEIWELLFSIPMPWQALLAIALTIIVVPCIAIKLIPWIVITIIHIASFSVEKIVYLILFIECQLSQSLRKNNKNPPFVFYIAGGILVFIKKSAESLLLRAKRFSPRKWQVLPVIAVFIWFFYQNLNVVYSNTIAWWHEINKYVYYTVNDGDCLSKIAAKYHVPMYIIVSENRERYPTLIYNQNEISRGWVLKIPRYYSSDVKRD